ncbi:hypothetical protein VPH35_037208 [Triticum aestivum]
MAAVEAVVDLSGGIGVVLLHPSGMDPAIAASPGETHDLVIGRWRRFGVLFSLLGASSRSSASASGAGGWRWLWRPDFCGNDDGGSNVGDAAMVAVVGSSLACPRDCLGLFAVVESKLRRRGPVVYDDRLQVARLAILLASAVPGFVHRSRSCAVWPQVAEFWLRFSCSFTCSL